MFFLILLGQAYGEKNCAAFGRDLREFSRGRRECDGWRRWDGRLVVVEKPVCAARLAICPANGT
ncbi:TPA: hypothetical protein SAY52_004172 [Burkholderia cenocepacia]|uniref:hypothetical protein n=1 Tax=unclassified Burkholderia TaxID=2613784 RepID=UPI00158DB0F5|nr:MULTISPECIES: hypothetical protein [unclassified Burkholderia]HEF5873517.1 hypothetical protein [Burkholderia cenocepacia]